MVRWLLRGRPTLFVTYLALVGVPLAVLLWVISLRPAGVSSGVQIAANGGAGFGLSELAMLAAEISVVLIVSRLVGSLPEKIRQPRVIGELLAGILLGPSVLGWAFPTAWAVLFPTASFGVLNALSQLGLVLFMFLVGLEVNLSELHQQGRVAILVSHASIATPIALGSVLAVYLYPRVSDPSVEFRGFALYMGAAMSVTAFPVLARILSDRKMLRTPMGTLAIACAAIDDVTGWCVLACIVAQVRAAHSAVPLWMTAGGLAIFGALMFGGARVRLRAVERHYMERGMLSDNMKAALLLFLMLSALITEALGLHLLFGAFVSGADMPKGREFVSYVAGEFEPLTMLLLLPLFFAYTGLRTSIGQIGGLAMWGLCLSIIAVAVIGKFGATSLAARLGGIGWRDSLGLGALMNTRGLMEVVVLNIGLDIHVISTRLFSMMVVMAIVTTMMTPPLLDWIYPSRAGGAMGEGAG